MILEILPKKFDTPMFWDDDDLAELKGTAVVGWFSQDRLCCRISLIPSKDKLGKEQVEADYKEKIVPALQVRSSLFMNR